MAGEQSPLIERDARIPPAPFTKALSRTASKGATSKRLPQTIAHRGHKAAFPENTLGAFRGAVEVGTHAIETDVHLSKDGVVVLSHVGHISFQKWLVQADVGRIGEVDATLERCYGKKEKIADCDWSYLSGLKTLKAPHESLPRLVDLLAYLAEPGVEDIWLLLDIKQDDDPDELLGGVAAAIASVPASKPWKDRIVIGCWNATYIELCKEYLAGFPTAFIGWSLLYASWLLREPNVSFNILQQSLVGLPGWLFLKAARKAERNVYLWTVNEEEWMEWSIHKGVDGVITDDPELFLEVCRRCGEVDSGGASALAPRRPPSRLRRIRQYVTVAQIQILTLFFTVMLFFKSVATARKQRRKQQRKRTP